MKLLFNNSIAKQVSMFPIDGDEAFRYSRERQEKDILYEVKKSFPACADCDFVKIQQFTDPATITLTTKAKCGASGCVKYIQSQLKTFAEYDDFSKELKGQFVPISSRSSDVPETSGDVW